MNKYFMVITLALLATGCDKANETVGDVMMQIKSNGKIDSPAIAIHPGWEINDHGKRGVIHGFNRCPPSVFSGYAAEGCVIIHPEDESVTVLITTSEEAEKEVWTVERRGVFPDNSLRLKRPDNTYVTPWKTAVNK